MSRKKQRSLIRQKYKLRKLIKNIDGLTPTWDASDVYEHFHVPSDQFIEYKRTKESIKTEFCKKWLAKAEEIIKQKPSNIEFCKVVALLDVPNYWSSQIIIFYDEEYYNTFWDRKSEYQEWNEVDNKQSFAKEKNIDTVLPEKGYEEIIRDEHYSCKSMLWFYGDVFSK